MKVDEFNLGGTVVRVFDDFMDEGDVEVVRNNIEIVVVNSLVKL